MKKIFKSLEFKLDLFGALVIDDTLATYWLSEALAVLETKLVWPQLIYSEYKNVVAEKGETVTITVPRSFDDAEEFVTQLNPSDLQGDVVSLTLDKHLAQSFYLNNKQKQLSAIDLFTTYVKPAAMSVVRKIDKVIANLMLQFPRYVGTPGTTPDALEDLIEVFNVLDELGVPEEDRNLVLNYAARTKLLAIPTIAQLNTNSEGNKALKQGDLGTLYTMKITASAHNPEFTSGSDTSGAVNLTAGYSKGVKFDTTGMVVDGFSAALVAGQIFNFANHDTDYVVLAGSTTTSLKFWPELQEDVANDVAITAVGNASTLTRNSLAFSKNAIGAAWRSLGDPGATVAFAEMEINGISLRIMVSFEHTKMRHLVSVDTLMGAIVVDPYRGVRLLG